jgi:F-type H+-transporting ATPase subunit alpha
VSRVGGNAQTKIMKKVGGRLRISMAQYRELAAFAQFGSDLDPATQAQLTRGGRLVEVLKQKQYAPMSLSNQVLQIYAGTAGLLDDLPVGSVVRFCEELVEYAKEHGQDIVHEIETVRDLSDELEAKMKSLILRCKDKLAGSDSGKD